MAGGAGVRSGREGRRRVGPSAQFGAHAAVRIAWEGDLMTNLMTDLMTNLMTNPRTNPMDHSDDPMTNPRTNPMTQ